MLWKRIVIGLVLCVVALGCRGTDLALDPATRERMVAALPKHSVPLTANVTSGYTFSGFTRSVQTGAVETSVEESFGPTFIAGHHDEHALFWNRVEIDRFYLCDPTQALHSVTDAVTDQVVLHFIVDASGVPGDVTAMNVVIPSFQESPPSTTSPFPIGALGVDVTLDAGGTVVSGTLVPAAPPPGAQASFLVTFPVPLPVDGTVQVDVTLRGAVTPASGPSTSFDLGCPPPNDALQGMRASGTARLLVQNTFVVLFVEEAPKASRLAVHPQTAMLDASQTQSFAAFNCPLDANGNPDPGPDGVPGTSDDLCTPADAQWTTTGGIGTVSPLGGHTTTLVSSLPPGRLSESGQVIATDGDDAASADVTVNAVLAPVVEPSSANVPSGESQTFDAFRCPLDANGNPDPGPDGVPGTSDDLCTPADAQWTSTGGIGTVSPPTGSSTTFTAVELPSGQTASGAVVAGVGGTEEAQASVLVTGQGPNTHAISIEVERMFRQGVPVAEPVPAGDTEVVVRPTTAHELDESLGTLNVGATVLPFDARATLLGELVSCERTVVSVSPPDLEAMRQAILDDIEASGWDPTNPRHVALFLRRNPDRGRVTLQLDAGVDRDLDPSFGAWLGNVDKGFLGFRSDLLLREAQRERIVFHQGEERRVRVALSLVENAQVTNVLPYDDSLGVLELLRLRKPPEEGGIFQGSGVRGMAQLIAVHDGRGARDGRTNWRDLAVLHTASAGEDSARAAHALAHFIGHLLFGPSHDTSSPLSIMHGDPAAGTGDEFYETNFDDFSYSDRTVQRGVRQLDRRWRSE